MEAVAKQSKATRRERWAWYMYDFGNSAYAAVILLAVFATYFKDVVVGQEEYGTGLWSQALFFAMLTVAIIAPILGAIADFSGAKKRFLLAFTSVTVTFTGLLFFVQEGNIFRGMLFFVLAEIGYRGAQVFYNSLLPEIASKDEMAKVSGNGWAIGSVGGIVCLLVVLAAIMLVGGKEIGGVVIETRLIIRLSMVFTAVYFVLSTIPTILWIEERAEPKPLPAGENYLTVAFKQLVKTFSSLKHYKEFVKFLISFLIYNDAILMGLDFAAIIGLVLFGLEGEGLIIFMIIVQVASVAGGYLGGFLADRFDNKRSLIIMILVMAAAVVGLIFNNTLTGFYILGSVVGLSLSSIQAVSRGLVGLFSPEGQSAEFYGLFAIAGRTSSFIGPAIFGMAVIAATRFYRTTGNAFLWFTERNELGAQSLAEQSGHRIAMVLIILFLVAGLAALLSVNEKKAKEAAVSPVTEPAPAD